MLAKHAPDPVPALLIGRLAVDRSVAGLGIGTALVAHVLANAVALNEHAACRAVVVTGLDAAARSWWERLGFHPFEAADPDSFDLYLLTTEYRDNAGIDAVTAADQSFNEAAQRCLDSALEQWTSGTSRARRARPPGPCSGYSISNTNDALDERESTPFASSPGSVQW